MNAEIGGSESLTFLVLVVHSVRNPKQTQNVAVLGDHIVTLHGITFACDQLLLGLGKG